MSKSSQRKKREERKRELERAMRRELERISDSSSPVPGSNDHGNRPSDSKANDQPNARTFLGFPIRQWIFGLLVWGCGTPFFNYVSSDPRILYVPWIAFSGWLFWMFWKSNILRLVVAPLIAVCLFIGTHIYVTSRIAAAVDPGYLRVSGTLKPANEPSPKLTVPDVEEWRSSDPLFSVRSDEVLLLLGDFAVSTAASNFVVLRLYGEDLLTISRTNTGISVFANVLNEDGELFAALEGNRFRINQKTTIPITTPDKHSLIVEDVRKKQVLNVRFLNPTTIKITGTFKTREGPHSVVIGETNIVFNWLSVFGGIALHVEGESIFDWPGYSTNSLKRLLPTPKTEIPSNKTHLVHDFTNNVTRVILRTQDEDFLFVQIGGKNVRGVIPFFANLRPGSK
jgi:hypothetical protein